MWFLHYAYNGELGKLEPSGKDQSLRTVGRIGAEKLKRGNGFYCEVAGTYASEHLLAGVNSNMFGQFNI